MTIDPRQLLEALAVPMFVAHDSIGRAKDMAEELPDVAGRIYIFAQLTRAQEALNQLLEALSRTLGPALPAEWWESDWLNVPTE